MNDIDVILADCPGLGRVRMCDCNFIHLTIGPVTLHLEPQALAQTALMMRTAMEQLVTVLEARAEIQDAFISPDALTSKLTH